ncbi:hypothetical protein Pan216_12220 [Planctomycetes bacterium Pan216]|uniref:Flippase-like domain-containing protein n=1 Tax=Kolteria novifilia TaxID=2527975 RepID=A0A518B075_9BACT|nr:hypothetical protein Pan216_12220 [Planctomycetes bacterium Pan216]
MIGDTADSSDEVRSSREREEALAFETASTGKSPSGRLAAGIRWLLFLVVLVFVGRYVMVHARDVGSVPVPSPWLFGASTLVGLAGYSLVAVAYCFVLSRHGAEVSFPRMVGVVYLPQLAKYVPGKIWTIVVAMELFAREGVARRVALVTIALVMAAGLLANVLTTLLLGGEVILRHFGPWTFGIALGSLVAFAFPPCFYGLSNWGLRLLGKEPLSARLSLWELLLVVITLVVTCLLTGTAFFLLLASFYPVSWDQWPTIAAIFLSAQVAGFVALFAPAGIGVREGILLMGLQGIVGPGPAIVVTGVCRLWQTAIELMLAAIGWIMLRHAPASSVAEEARGDSSS